MSALRKSQAPEILNAGHRWTWYMETLATHHDMPSDARLMLAVLVGHDGDRRQVNPGIRRLKTFMNMSVGRVLTARDDLLERGLITEDRGAGTRSSVYHLVALDAWFEERASVRNSPSSVPVSGSSVHPVETKPSEPSEPEKKDHPVLRLVQSTGWEALKMRAPDTDRRFWLDKLTLKGADPDGTIHLEAESSHVADWVRNMLLDIGKLGTVARSVGIDPDKVKIRAPKHGRDPYPADQKTVPLTRAGQEEMAEAIENKPDKPALVAYAENTVSLEAYRTRRDDALREMDDGGVPVGDAEVAWPQQPDAGPERPHQGGDSGAGGGRTARQDAPCRDGGETQPGLEAGGVSDRGTRDGGDRGTAPPPAQHQPAVPALEDAVTQPLGEHHEQHDDDDRPG